MSAPLHRVEPAGTGARRERADAARNRQRVLAAAEELFARHGAHNVTMEDIARAAGVGKGTLYRRYPDRASIAVALLDEHERALQERLLSGPPPLGPGAPAGERLAAFYAAMVDLLERHIHLALGAERGDRRFAAGAYGFCRAHVHALISASRGGDERGAPPRGAAPGGGAPGGDRPPAGPGAGRPSVARDAGVVDALVDVLLAPLAPELYAYQRQQRGRSAAEISTALAELAHAVLGGPGA
jgi:AcrR family transcriptional regulator